MNLTKKISFILIISILSVNLSFLTFPPQKANASGIPVVDIIGNAITGSKDIWDVLGKAGMALLSIATKSLARMLINSITNETVRWIGGFGDKNNPPPSFVSDLPKFLGKVEDKTIGNYIENDPNLKFLCDPFKNQIKIALGLSVGNPGHLFEGSNCSLTQVKNNVINSVNGGVGVQASANLTVNNESATLNGTFSPNDFSSNGGWDSWLDLTTVPQNNIQGAYLIAQSDMNWKIQSAKEEKKTDIVSGGGALSLKTCIDTYMKDGNPMGEPSDQYFEGQTPKYSVPSYNPQKGQGQSEHPDSGPNPSGITVDSVCTIKTPGGIVSTQLAKSITADTDTTIMLAALGDGIDAIFNAIASKLFNVAMEQLQGVFGDSPARDDMNNAVMEAASAESERIQEQMNNDIQTMQNAYNTDESLESLSALSFLRVTSGAGTGGVGDTGGAGGAGGAGGTLGSNGEFIANTGDNLYAPRNQAFTLINYYIKSEKAYQSNYGIILNILTQAKKVFASSSACNFNLPGTTPTIRALMIRAEVITNIDGTQDSTRQIASIPWNLITINSALEKSNANLSLLNYAGNTVLGSPSVQTINEAMIPVNSTSFNTDAQTPLIGYVKDWLTRVQFNYDTPLCPIDLTNVLKITTP